MKSGVNSSFGIRSFSYLIKFNLRDNKDSKIVFALLTQGLRRPAPPMHFVQWSVDDDAARGDRFKLGVSLFVLQVVLNVVFGRVGDERRHVFDLAVFQVGVIGRQFELDVLDDCVGFVLEGCLVMEGWFREGVEHLFADFRGFLFRDGRRGDFGRTVRRENHLVDAHGVRGLRVWLRVSEIII